MTEKLVIEPLTDADLEELRRFEPAVDWKPFIDVSPDVLAGKPAVRGTRLAAELILNRYAAGWTDAMVLESYPRLTPEAIRAVFAYAAECVSERQARPPDETPR